MKTVLTIIGLAILCLAATKSNQQPNPKFANVEIEGFSSTELLRKPIKNIEAVAQNSANAFYVTDEEKIKLYIMEELPKPLNVKELIAAANEAEGASNKVNEDKTFVIEKRTTSGEMSIDLWAHSRKVVEVNGKRILILTADQIYIAPNIKSDLYFTFLDGNYSWKTPEQRKSYLVFRQLGQTPINFPNKVWTEGASSIIKVGMSAPEIDQIKFLNKTISLQSYPTIGYIDLLQTMRSKTQS